MRRLRVAINIGLLTLVLLLLSTTVSPAWAPPVPRWARTYGGTGFDFAFSVGQTSDGGFIVAGHTFSSFGAGGDAWVLRLDSKGNIGHGHRCSLIGLSTAVVTDTAVFPSTIAATVTSSSATVTSTSVTGTPSSATTSVQCHFPPSKI